MQPFETNPEQASPVTRWVDPETGRAMAVGPNGSPFQNGQPLALPKSQRKVGHPAFDRATPRTSQACMLDPKVPTHFLRLHPTGPVARDARSMPNLRIV